MTNLYFLSLWCSVLAGIWSGHFFDTTEGSAAYYAESFAIGWCWISLVYAVYALVQSFKGEREIYLPYACLIFKSFIFSSFYLNGFKVEAVAVGFCFLLNFYAWGTCIDVSSKNKLNQSN